ncbi:hypothetical protein ACWC0C_04135 [Streptomyces sp. NPDC001709]
MRTRMRRHLVAGLLVGCCSLVSCGTQRADAAREGSPSPRATVVDKTCDVESAPEDTSDDQQLPDTTTDDQGLPDTTSDDQELPDTTSDDQELPDTTSDDQELPDTTSDDQGLPDTTTDDQGSSAGGSTDAPGVGPHRWFPMTREFRAYLTTSAPKGDAAVAAHVTRVCIRTPDDSGRTEADVWVDYGVWQDAELERAAKAFAHWRQSVYGDHGHVTALAPAKMNADLGW